MPRRSVAVLVSLALASPLLLLSGPASAAPTPAKPYDVNGDGFPEQVVGAPDLQVGSVKGAGGVFVLPASKKGVSTAGTDHHAGDDRCDRRSERRWPELRRRVRQRGLRPRRVRRPRDRVPGRRRGSGDDDRAASPCSSARPPGCTGARSIVLHRAGRPAMTSSARPWPPRTSTATAGRPGGRGAVRRPGEGPAGRGLPGGRLGRRCCAVDPRLLDRSVHRAARQAVRPDVRLPASARRSPSANVDGDTRRTSLWRPGACPSRTATARRLRDRLPLGSEGPTGCHPGVHGRRPTRGSSRSRSATCRGPRVRRSSSA